MKYKVGDIVRITEDVKSLEDFGIIGSATREIAGKTFFLYGVDEDQNLYSVMHDNLEWWLNEEQIKPANEEQIEGNKKAFLFSYWLDSASYYGYQSEQIIVIAGDQKEANKKFYEWLVENNNFVKLTVQCEAHIVHM